MPKRLIRRYRISSRLYPSPGSMCVCHRNFYLLHETRANLFAFHHLRTDIVTAQLGLQFSWIPRRALASLYLCASFPALSSPIALYYSFWKPCKGTWAQIPASAKILGVDKNPLLLQQYPIVNEIAPAVSKNTLRMGVFFSCLYCNQPVMMA